MYVHGSFRGRNTSSTWVGECRTFSVLLRGDQKKKDGSFFAAKRPAARPPNPARVSARFCLLSRGWPCISLSLLCPTREKIMVLLVLYVVLVYLHHSSDPFPPPVVRPPPCLSVVHPCVCAPSSDRSALPTSPLHPNAPLPRSAYLSMCKNSILRAGGGRRRAPSSAWP